MRIADISPSASYHTIRQAARKADAGWVLALTATVAFSVAPPVARYAILGGFDSTALLTLFRVGVGPVVFRRREPPHTPNAINLLVVVLSRVYIGAVGWKALYQRLFWNGASASV